MALSGIGEGGEEKDVFDRTYGFFLLSFPKSIMEVSDWRMKQEIEGKKLEVVLPKMLTSRRCSTLQNAKFLGGTKTT